MTISATFGDDLIAAGLQDGVSWTADGTITFRADVDQTQRDAVTALAASPTLASLRNVQVALVTASCAAAIVAGFTSSALGAPYNYPSDPTSQTNLLGSVMASLFPGLAGGWTTPFWCQTTDTNHTWAFVAHTAAQIQQVGQDGKTLVVTCQAKLATLQASIAAAGSADAIAAITW